ncbi:ABC transporter substrate-binding protein [Planctomonas psychrotolerans]|uniref:ABC transporter substrate-binding protein n=1 Tax=Planctomonas psychrotolerans TaxID=2528712 RepID=UPI001D0CF334|nr:sugar ABC transporter substrate-binding protein [Planctomonas psychrotolerans]
MKITRMTTAVSVGLATMLLASGCSSSSGGGDGDVRLQMVESLTNPTRTALLKELLADFETENPGVTVELISPPTDQADQKIQQMLQAGNGIDVLEVRDITVGPFSANGWISDMTEVLDGWEGWEDMTANAVDYATNDDGQTYYIPYGFYGLSVFYRTDLVEAAGFDGPPETWAEMLEQATAIQESGDGNYGYAFRGGTNGNGNLATAIEAYVADDIDTSNGFKLTDGSSIFSAPEAQDAADMYFELFAKASPPSSVAWGYPEMVEGFSNGSTAFLLQDPEVISAIGSSTAITEDQWDTAPLVKGPTGKAVQAVATSGWGTAESSEHKEEAAELIKFLSSGDASTRFTKENSLVPILTSAAEDEFYSTGAWASYVTMTENPDTYISVIQPRSVEWWTEWTQKADSEVQRVLVGDMTSEELLASWDEYWMEKWAE